MKKIFGQGIFWETEEREYILEWDWDPAEDHYCDYF
jgi:hypothetical protein